MKLKLYLCFAGVLACLLSNAQTHKCGVIAGETWRKSSSPYIIDCDIFIASLTIEPGVVVMFSGNYVFEVGGILAAIGTENDSIRFMRQTSAVTWKGVLFQNSLPGTVMKHCIIENANTSGIRISASLPQIANCSIRNNTSFDSGGGLKISRPDTATAVFEISFCTVEGNIISTNYTMPVSNGGGVWVSSNTGTVRFKNCIIRNNQCIRGDGHPNGGGVFANGMVEFLLCTITNNYVYGRDDIPGGNSAGNGGGVYVQNGSVSFSNTIINNNRAEGYAIGGMSGNAGYAYGGGINVNSGQVSFFNSIVAGNVIQSTHGSQGGGLLVTSGLTHIENCTLADNELHAIHNNADTVNVINSILYFNNGGGTNPQVVGKLRITYSDVQGGYTGTGNINFHPLFPRFGICNYQIVPPSFCIDAGSTSLQYNDSCLPPSLGTSRNDMGAHGGPRACLWSLAGSPCRIVPVTWLYFKGQLHDKDVLLTWVTASEQNSKEFIVERSSDGRNFTAIGTIPAVGNSSQITNYQFSDFNAMRFTAPKVHYRLKQVDLDGKFVYSSVVNIAIRQDALDALVYAYPNPFTQTITLQLSEPPAGTTDNVELYSSEGKLFYRRNLSTGNGTTILLNDLPALSKGVYFLEAVVNGKRHRVSLIKNK